MRSLRRRGSGPMERSLSPVERKRDEETTTTAATTDNTLILIHLSWERIRDSTVVCCIERIHLSIVQRIVLNGK